MIMCVISRLPQTSDAKRVGDSSNIVCRLADTGRRLRYYERVRKKIESEAILALVGIHITDVATGI